MLLNYPSFYCRIESDMIYWQFQTTFNLFNFNHLSQIRMKNRVKRTKSTRTSSSLKVCLTKGVIRIKFAGNRII